MKSSFLRTKDLVVGYDSKNPILQSVNMELNRGELISLTGHNGAGKSTLIKTLTGILPALSGKIIKDSFLRISLVPQTKSIHLDYPLTVERTLLLPREAKSWKFWKRQMLSPSDMELVERFQMKDLLNQLLKECSGGQLQKVLILRALLSNYDLLVLDEPVDALDANSQILAFEEFKRYTQENKTILIITHNNSYEWMSKFQSHYQVKDGSLFLHCSDDLQNNSTAFHSKNLN